MTKKKKNPYIFNKSNTIKVAEKQLQEKEDLPLLALVDRVLFPGTSIVVTTLNELNIDDITNLKKEEYQRVAVVTKFTETDSKDETETLSQNISLVGTESMITGVIKLQTGEIGIILKGLKRFVVKKIYQKNKNYYSQVQYCQDTLLRKTPTLQATAKVLKSRVLEMLKLNTTISKDVESVLLKTDNPDILCNFTTPYLSISIEEKVALLATFDLRVRIKQTLAFLLKEIEILKISTKIQTEVQSDIKENLRRNLLHEQLAVIKKELGEQDGEQDEIEDLLKSIEKLKLPKEAREAAEKEIDRLEMTNPSSPEYMVSWTYINWIKDLPWDQEKNTLESLSFTKATKIFDKNHYGLDKVKERILEYIAVLQHKGNIPGQILLLHGPPGVGKSSLVKSIAEVLKRPYAKVSLGGVKDEAEIRGHRKTYIGSMPGKILHALKEAGSSKAVILLDEIDKIGHVSSSELSSSLLEVLDPEQNKKFVDHYLALPYDLSQIIFVATANNLASISAPLLDRMECIDIPGYIEQEKLMIASKHLVPNVCEELNLTSKQLFLNQGLLKLIINNYTREAGVRQLKRSLQTIGRKVVKSIVCKTKTKPLLRPKVDNIISLIGPPPFLSEPKDQELLPGVSVGLAYTSLGGDILYIESQKVTSSSTKGKLSLTGSLGKVMQESAQTCLWYLIANSERLGLSRSEIEKSDLHLHFPDGATPKDGPSAGLAILCTLVSLFKNKSLPNNIAMTGEITLRGQVLPVGGIKEKLLAALRYDKKKIIIPHANFLDLEDLPQEALNELSIYPIKKMEDVLVITGLIKGPKIKPLKYKKNRLKLKNSKTSPFDIQSLLT